VTKGVEREDEGAGLMFGLPLFPLIVKNIIMVVSEYNKAGRAGCG
jgi:hypothetical protein